MKVTKTRFFKNLVTGNAFAEVITWLLAGESVSLNDPRVAPIGQLVNGIDLWLPISVRSPGFDMQNADHVYNEEQETMFDDKGMTYMGSRRTTVATYNQLNLYSLPFKANVVEIDESEYNTIMSSLNL